MSYSDAPGPELVIQHTGQVFSLTYETVSIGAAEDNTIILGDPEVSAHHAIIYWQAESNTYAIQDLGSAGGTFVNEQRVEGTVRLRDGDVVRVGDTFVDVRLAPLDEEVPVIAAAAADAYDDEQDDGVSRSPLLIGIVVVLLAGVTIACLALAFTLLFAGDGGTPAVTIQSPSDGAQIVAGNQVILQATASGTDDINVLEMSVDGVLVASGTSADPDGQSSLTVSKDWVFVEPGGHEVSAVARTASGKTSKPESIQVTVVAAEIPPGATSTPTPLPGQPTNTPTPAAEVTHTPTPVPPPTSTPIPGETVVLPPQIEYFQASPMTINAGGCTTLQWGTVSGATEAFIEPDIGGVSTPGSSMVCPAETTTYRLMARGPGGQTQAETTVTVVGALADLLVDSILFEPKPAIVGQETVVTIAIRNAGTAPAGAFNWEWRAGTDARYDGRLRGLNAGETTVVTVRWSPSAVYAGLDTVARVDIDDEVPESNEDNNEAWARVQVVEGDTGGVETVTLPSQAELDGYRSNDGRGSNKADIFVGNSELSQTVGEVVWRGFISFDISSIPGDAILESVELRFYQAKVGGDPYAKLGNLILDHVDFGSSLDASDFDLLAQDSAVLAPQPNGRSWYVFNSSLFDNWLEKDLAAGQPRFQLRLRWQTETDGDGLEDYAGIESADDFFGTGNLPQLIVTYTR